jgi:hypothetical protein
MNLRQELSSLLDEYFNSEEIDNLISTLEEIRIKFSISLSLSKELEKELEKEQDRRNQCHADLEDSKNTQLHISQLLTQINLHNQRIIELVCQEPNLCYHQNKDQLLNDWIQQLESKLRLQLVIEDSRKELKLLILEDHINHSKDEEKIILQNQFEQIRSSLRSKQMQEQKIDSVKSELLVLLYPIFEPFL